MTNINEEKFVITVLRGENAILKKGELPNETLFRIWTYPYHLAGSGSNSGDEDPDPASKINIVKLS